MLNDGKKHWGRGRPLTHGGRHGAINHYWDEPDVLEVQGKGLAPPGGEDHRNLNSAKTRRGSSRGRLPRG